MDTTSACAALRAGKCLELRYSGFTRVVEVHAVGYTKAGALCMRVWQVRGGSASGERVGWKLLNLDDALSARLTEENAEAPRPGYSRGDSAMRKIVCEL